MQRKLCYLLMGFVALIMVSCQLEPKSMPLTATLANYAKQDSAGKWSLLGVKEMGTDKVIIKPDNYEYITADEQFITAVKMVNGSKQIWLYMFDGECLGWFDTYNYFSSPENYCVATNYDQTFYYFPETKTSIRTPHSYGAINYLFAEVDNMWKVYTYKGNLVSVLPLESKLLHNLTSDAKETFYVVSEEQEKVTLQDIEGKEKKTYSLKEWLKQSSQLKIAKELPHLTILEIRNF